MYGLPDVYGCDPQEAEPAGRGAAVRSAVVLLSGMLLGNGASESTCEATTYGDAVAAAAATTDVLEARAGLKATLLDAPPLILNYTNLCIFLGQSSEGTEEHHHYLDGKSPPGCGGGANAKCAYRV